MHPIKEMVSRIKKGEKIGICSVCSANPYVIRACMRTLLNYPSQFFLVESTANQVNQFGGYTGMYPLDFMKYVLELAGKESFPIDRIIFGGDHLGPLVWKAESEVNAMSKASVLVADYVKAGFTKIHIDTSMKLGSDDLESPLSDNIIAERSAILADAALGAFYELKKIKPESEMPVFIIGSEVPVPGGSTEHEDTLEVTDPVALDKTIKTFERIYSEHGLEQIWDRVVGFVVQPGVEFGDDIIHDYVREEAKDICSLLSGYPNLIFEGHSTDYQKPALLRQMVEDGIAILKVGPQLTFALREAIFSLENIENNHPDIPDDKKSHFSSVLENVMVENPRYWKSYFIGNELELKFSRAYSFSDRTRYYIGDERVQNALDKLLLNLREAGIPLTLLSQFMPLQYKAVRNKTVSEDPEELLMSAISDVYCGYLFAIGENGDRI